MTECDRFIEEGKFSESFYMEEERCNYIVPSKMKKIWAVEIDLYQEIARVCDKYGLRYYVLGGTLIGAIRHKGFIPWDDDLDIGMPRKDYNFLCEKLQSEFTEPYFLQTQTTDPGYYISFARVRNSRTTSVSIAFKNAPFNQGIAVDIFPLDYCDPEESEFIESEIRTSILRCSSYMKRGSEQFLDSRQLENLKMYWTDSPNEEYSKIQRLASRIEKSDFIGIPVCTIYKWNRLTWPAGCFDSYEMIPFENICVRIPSGWDSILSICFGNYMEFPPVEKRGNWHSGVIWDPDKSFREYLKER